MRKLFRFIIYTILIILLLFIVFPSYQSFELITTQDDGDLYRDVYVNESYVYTARLNDGVSVYSFDGSTYTLLDTEYNGGGQQYSEIWEYDEYVFAAVNNHGVEMYSFNNSVLTLIDTKDNASGDSYRDVWANESFVFTACNFGGICCYSWNSIGMTFLDKQDDGGYYTDIWANDSYVFATNGTYILAYHWNGTNLNYINMTNVTNTMYDIYGGNGYIYAAAYTGGVSVWSFNGTGFTFHDKHTDGEQYLGVYYHSNYTFTACRKDGLRAYIFNGSNVNLEDEIDDGNDYYAIDSNDTYIHVACEGAGIRAYYMRPDEPYNVNVVYNTSVNQENISWTKGNRTSHVVVVQKATGYPTSVTDGTVVQNSTLDYYTFNPTGTMYYALYGYDNNTYLYSSQTQVTWGAIGLNCYNESDYTESIIFDIEISNQDGTDVYTNTSQSNTLYLNYEDIPFGDNTVFVISNSSFSTRVYYKDLVENTFYNFSFYLPENGNATAYLLTVEDENSFGVDDAKIIIRTEINGSYQEVTSLLTDANGDAVCYLIPDRLYKVNISKDGYDDEVADYIPTSAVQTKTFQLNTETDTYENLSFDSVITFSASMNNLTGVITVTYDDSLTNTSTTSISIYDNETTAAVDWDNRTGDDSFSYTYTGNTTRAYSIYLNLSHTNLGSVVYVIFLEGSNVSSHRGLYDKDWLEGLFEGVFGENAFGWVAMINFFILIGCLFSFGKKNTGTAMVVAGGVMLFLDFVLGLEVLGATMGGSFIVIGIIVQKSIKGLVN